MSTRTLSWLSAAATAAVLSLAPAETRADFALVSQDLSINKQANEATFTLTFNQQPNFTTTDAAGRPADSFQVEFDGTYDPALPSYYPTALTAVVRGDEIHDDNGNIVVRSPSGVGGANSGGWGPVLTAVPFTKAGNSIIFTTPAADLGAVGTAYQYAVYSLQYGSMTAEHVVTSIPTPAGWASGLAGLAVVAGVTARVRRRQVRAHSA